MTRTPIDASEAAALELEEHARSVGERLRSAELPEVEREQMEDLLLADDRLFEQVLIAEEELIDSLASDRGAGGPRGILERDTRLAFARALRQAAGPKRGVASEAGPGRDRARRGPQRRLLRWAAAAAAIALATIALWWTIPRTEEDREAAVYVVSPSSTRGALSEAVLLPPRGGTVELWLEVASENGPDGLFAAELVAADGEVLFYRASLRSQSREWGRVVVFKIPAADLDTGHYGVHLRAGSADGADRLVERYELNVARSETE